MSPHTIVVLTDRLERGRALAEAVRVVARCSVVGVDEAWQVLDPVLGIIADLSLDLPQARHCLRTLAKKRGARSIPLLYLAPTRNDDTLREAERLGATACFQSLITTPRAAVAALFRQVAPNKSMTDLLVEHSYSLVSDLFVEMFAEAQSGRIELTSIDAGADPIFNALREGGLKRWIDLVQSHDDMTVRHCLLVAGFAAHFAIHLGLPARDRATMVRAGLVHDVGKALIPLAVLNKPGRLDNDETTLMRMHAAYGHEILSASGLIDPVVLAVTRHHHEMLDGTGYPDGLKGVQISDPVRLLTICDIYAALIERRPYRPPMTQEAALAILRSMAGLIEPALVDAFAASL